MEHWQAERINEAKQRLRDFITRCQVEREAISRRENEAISALLLLGDIDDPDLAKKMRRGRRS